MEISNRKLFSRGMAAISLLVAVSGTAAETPAVTESEDAAANRLAAYLDDRTDLSIKEAEQRRERYVAQDKKLEEARKLRSEEKFAEAVKIYEEIIFDLDKELAVSESVVARSRRNALAQENSVTRGEWGRALLKRAERALIDGRYSDTISLATDVQNADPAAKDEATELVEEARARQRAEEAANAVKLSTFDPKVEQNLEMIKKLLAEAETFYQNRKFEEARNRLERVYLLDPYNVKAIAMMGDIYRQFYTYGLHRHLADTEGMVAFADWQWAEPVFVVNLDAQQVPQGEVRTVEKQGIAAKLDRIIFPSIAFDDADIMAVIRFLNSRSKVFDPDKEGVRVSAGLDAAARDSINRLTLNLPAPLPMSDVIRYVCQYTGLKSRIDADGVFLAPEVARMQYRIFQVRGDLISQIPEGGDVDNAMGGGAPIDMPVEAPRVGGGGGGEGDDGFLSGPGGRKRSISDAALMRFFESLGIEFPPGSSITYNVRGGKLTVQNTAENLTLLDDALRRLDAGTKPMIMVEIKAIEISQTDVQELGFDWSLYNLGSNMGSDGTLVDENKNGWIFGQGANRLPVIRGGTGESSTSTGTESSGGSSLINGLNIFPALFGSRHPFGSDLPLNITLSVNALSQSTRAETLSAPKLLTVNDKDATIDMVKTYWFPQSWDEYEIEDDDNGARTLTAPVPDFSEDGEDIGVKFKVRARIKADNYTINLKVTPEVTNYIGRDTYSMTVSGELRSYQPVTNPVPGGPTTQLVVTPTTDIFEVWKPIITKRKLDVNVDVYDGETIVLGGMIDNKTTTRTDKWPILGDLPLIGRFFQSQAEDTERTNLLLFVTARLVNNDGIPIRRNKQDGSPEFNR